ncbi:MAG TPA: imelysin family protein, partial [Microthrixaceae bacterium]|nr:imelysin family protein [Microthrixaceae bacterium]
ETGPEGRINAWPMDEAYVDYVEGDITAGIINDVATYPEVTKDVLVETNEEGGETNISTGWHAIEFLLWGQDLSETSPGNRPVTDYTTAANAERRATYLNLLGDVLVSDLTSVAEQWDPAGDDNYRKTFLADPAAAVGHIFRGIGALSVGELSGERIVVAVDTKDEEDEHSCFSDNTNADVVGDIVGINNVYRGTYPGVAEGPGLDTLVESVNSDTAKALGKQMDTSLELAKTLPEPFDRMIVGDSAPLQAIVDSLIAQGKLIASSAKDLGISVDTGV